MPRFAALSLLASLALCDAAGCCLEITGQSTEGDSASAAGASTGQVETGSSAGSGTSAGVGATSTATNTGGATTSGGTGGSGCIGDSRWIYVVDGDTAQLARFDPASLTFTYIGVLACPATAGDLPESMAVDQNGVAWVFYRGGNLFEADTSDASCSAVGNVPPPPGYNRFWGMSFFTSAGGGSEMLYIDGPLAPTSSELATLETPSLNLDQVGTATMNGAELAETDDGELWGFSWMKIDFGALVGLELAQLDPGNGTILQSTNYPDISIGHEGFAMKFWGGSFWVFIGSDVYQVPRDTLVPSLVLSNDGYNVVGAGVANCQAH